MSANSGSHFLLQQDTYINLNATFMLTKQGIRGLLCFEFGVMLMVAAPLFLIKNLAIFVLPAFLSEISALKKITAYNCVCEKDGFYSFEYYRMDFAFTRHNW